MTTQEILAKVASGDIEPTEAATLLDALKSNGRANGKLTYKVSSKGAVSVYGMVRLPVTLYAEPIRLIMYSFAFNRAAFPRFALYPALTYLSPEDALDEALRAGLVFQELLGRLDYI